VLNGGGFQNVVTMSGSRPDYAPSGWEHFISDEVKEDEFTVQLWRAGQPASEPVLVRTRADCQENLAYLVFEEVGQDDVPPESPSGTQVTLHVFSGRPDPTWTLTTAQEAELRRRLRDLSPTDQPFDENGGLGYSGFELSLPAAEGQPLQHVRVCKGVARVEAAGQVDQLADGDRTLERWLLDTAGGHVEADVVEVVRQELELDASRLPASLPPIHVVQAGETLLSIAARFDVSVEALAGANRLDEPPVLGVGRVLVIPSAEGTTLPGDAPGQFQWPTQRRDISGWSFHDPGDPQHPGLDVAAEMQDPVLAVAGGEVVFAGWGKEYGYLVVVKHAGDWLSLYSHLDQVPVQLGQSVRQGELVGRAGSTGMATGPHLHFELRYQGYPVDPLAYLPGDPAQPAFAIYLVKGEIAPAELQQRAPGELDLEDTPILTMDDILTYDWEVHELTLTGAAYDRVAGLEVSTGSGRPFVVTVHGEPVYLGAFWTSASSASFDGIVIDVLAATAGRPLRIQLGYPGADFYTGEDLRDDARVFQALQKAGKIPAPISHVVQPGDTLLGIAARYGVSVEALLAANEDSDAFLLQVGKTLLIPVGE
jgi:murein DD-endopeptidase MepM/ murein hydrolase activator NlpD